MIIHVKTCILYNYKSKPFRLYKPLTVCFINLDSFEAIFYLISSKTILPPRYKGKISRLHTFPEIRISWLVTFISFPYIIPIIHRQTKEKYRYFLQRHQFDLSICKMYFKELFNRPFYLLLEVYAHKCNS